MFTMSILKFLLLVFFLFLNCFHLTLSASFPLAVKRYPMMNGKRRLTSLVADSPMPPDYQSSINYTMALIATITFGSPPQQLEMVMDTGSEISYVTCADGRGDEPITKSFFNTRKSSSFEKLLCNRPSNCTEPEPSLTVDCINHTCHYSYYFVDGTLSEGDFFRENITLSDSQTILAGILLGCTAKNDTTGADGLMGMNLGKLSLMTQANIQRFSYCVPNHANPNNLNPSTAAGIFYLGINPNSNNFKYVDLSNPTNRPGFDNNAYTVLLTEITVGGEKIKVSDDFNTSSGCPMLIDSASQYSSLLSTPYSMLRVKIANLTTGFAMSEADVSKPLDMCFNTTNSTIVANKIGDVVFGFNNNVNITISKERLMDYVEKQGSCVAIGQSIDSTSVNNILGVYQQQCHWVEYDSQKRRVGFGEIIGCATGSGCG